MQARDTLNGFKGVLFLREGREMVRGGEEEKGVEKSARERRRGEAMNDSIL